MHLQSTDVDDPAAPADEVVAVAAQLDDVAGVDETVGVQERGRFVTQITDCECAANECAASPSTTCIPTSPSHDPIIARRETFTASLTSKPTPVP